jgi:metal-responsive CopG/Arc/MetJ family transcriptional regulator
MRNKRKLSITIDNKILEELERTTKAHKFSKSQLTEEALKLWFKKHTEELMAKGYKEMAKEDQEFAELSLEAQEEAIHE